MRLIDADALLLKSIDIKMPVDEKPSYFARAVLSEDIQSAPTIDAVEVVRCRDCVYFKHDKEKGITYCGSMGLEIGGNDYCCSYGERKDNDEV